MKKSAQGLIFLLLAFNLLSGCAPSSKSVQLKDPSKPDQVNGGSNSQKPEPTPDAPQAPEEPGDDGNVVPPAPNPTPTPIKDVSRVARIMCETDRNGADRFNTLRADVVSTYIMPSLIPYLNGRNVAIVRSPVPLQSDGKQAIVIMHAQADQFSPWKIYKSTANLLTQKADLQLLSNFEGPSKDNQQFPYLWPYTALKMEPQFLTANFKRTAYVYPNDSGTYIWESLKGSRIVLPMNASNSLSPFFVGGDDYVRFDQLSPNGDALTQKFYHFDTKTTLSLPPPMDPQDSQLFGYVNAAKTALFWVEGRPDGTWKIRTLGLKAGSKAVILGAIPGNPKSIVLPMTFLDQGETVLAYTEEDRVLDNRGQALFKTASLHLVKASAAQLRILSTQSIPYAEDFMMFARPTNSDGVLRHLFLEPISGKLYASNIPKGGLISFDLKSKSWGVHAMYENAFGCLNPQWGLEVPRD